MPQQTKTEALEEIARKMRRDILDGTAPLDEAWWWTDDVKMQDRIAHVLLDYDRDDEPTLRKQLVEMESLLASARQSRDEAVRACAQLRESNVALIGDRNDWRTKALALAPIQPALVVEEQGPWVVVRQAILRTGWLFYNNQQEDDWATSTDEATHFEDKAVALVIAAQTTKDYNTTWFARTLAEARAIEAQTAGGQ